MKKTATISIVLAMLFLVGSLGLWIGIREAGASAAPTNGLVGYWALDAGSGTTAIDSSGNSNNATLVNSPAWVTGKVNGALQFNGSTAFANAPILSPSWSSFSGGFSISFWAQTSNPSNSAPLSAFGTMAGFGLYYGSWYMGNGSAWTTVTSGMLGDGAWHFYTLTWDGTTMTSYRDGVSVQQAALSGASFAGIPSNQLVLGMDNRGGSYFSGSLDEVRLYDRGLSASEVAAVMGDPGLSGTSSGSGSAPAISSFTASPSSIASGQSATLTWSTSGATAVSISPTVGSVSVSGSTSVSPTSNATYTLTATNSNGSATAQATVTIGAAGTPSVPASLSASPASVSQINLSWSASTESGGSISGYKIYRNGVQVGTSATNSYADTGLSAATTYNYAVAAYDASGNTSAQSSIVSATTFSPSSGSGEVGPFLGIGCTTAYHIDKDCDGYGIGTDPNDPHPLKGPDADDSDPTVNTPASMLAKYGTLQSFLATVKGYHPNNIVYLSQTGNDSTCATNNINLPCVTFDKAYSLMSPGDAMVIRAGTIYATAGDDNTFAIGGGGTASQPDIFMAYPGERAILDHAPGTSNGMGIVNYFNAVSNVTIDGLVFYNTPCGGTTPASGADNCGFGIDFSQPQSETGIIIRNNEIKDYYRGIWITAGATNLLIEGNDIHDDYGEHEIYVAWNVGDYGTAAVGTTVRNNLLYNAEWDNFHTNGPCTNCTLAGNIMYSANMGQGGAAAIALEDGWNHSAITNNIVFSNSAFVLLYDDYTDSTGCCEPNPMNYNTVTNNTFVRTGRDATGDNLGGDSYSVMIIANQSTVPEDMGHNTYANNIFADISGDSSAQAVQYRLHQSTDPNWLSTDVWKNNIFYMSAGSPLSYGVNANGAPPAQTWSYFQANAGTFTNNLQSNPDFVAANSAWYNAPQNWDLHLLAGSPAIAAGTSVGAPATDIQGNARSTTIDIGAYEYSSGGSSGSGGGGGDTTPPIISMTAPSNNVTVSGSVTVTVSASDNVGVSSVQFKLDGANLGTPVTSAPYQVYWNSVGSSNGTHTLTAVASDAAGNQATAATVTVTVQNVVAPVITSSLSASATAGSSFSYQILASNSPTSYSASGLPSGLSVNTVTGIISGTPASAGSSNATISATNSAGTGSATFVVTVTNAVDTTPPTVPANLALTAKTTSTVTISWTASTDNFAVAGYKIYRCTGSGCTPSVQVGTTANTVYTDTGLTSGTLYVYAVSAYDAAGNVSAKSASVNAATQSLSDTIAPTTSITSPTNNAVLSGTVTITALASDNVGVTSVQFYLDGSLIGTDTTSPYTFSWNTTTAANGSHTLQTKAYDAAANVGVSTAIPITISNASQTLAASFTASPTSGTAPVAVSLTASAAGTAQGTVNYIFYCNRSDTGTNVTSPADLTVSAAATNSYTASNLCSYQTAGTYTPKVIVEQGTALPAQAQQSVAVSSSSGGTGSSGGGGSSGGTGSTGGSGGSTGGGGTGGGGGGGSTALFTVTMVVTTTTPTVAKVTVVNSLAATTQIFYGTSTSYGSTTIASPSLTTAYFNLAGLTPGLVYHAVAVSLASGQTESSPDAAFTTLVSGAAAPTNGLVGYWALDAGSGTTAIDSSGNSNNATLVNSPAWVTGKVNGALQFNGSTAFANAPILSPSWSSFSGGFSISFWAQTSNPSNSAPLSAFGTMAGFGLYYGSWYMGNGSAWTTVTSGMLGDGAWHFYTLTWDGTTMTSYRDGVSVQQAALSGASFAGIPSNQLVLGMDNRGGSYFSGSLDEVRLYDRGLSASEVAAVMGDPGLSPVAPVVPTSAKFTTGESVVVTAGPLSVRKTASTSGKLLGTQPVGAIGTVTAGPVSANGYNWWNIKYNSGASGWSVENHLAPAPSAKFTTGESVVVTAGPLSVRKTASTSGKLLGTQPVGAIGTVTAGPVSANGYNWWNIKYNSGASGWSVGNYLSAY